MNLAEILKKADAATERVELYESTFTPVPPGTYSVAVTDAEGPIASKRANPNNPSEHGQHIKLMLTIVNGEYANRKLFLRNNIIVYPVTMSSGDQEKAQKAMLIGARERKVIFDSLGKTCVENVNELIGATFKVEVKHDVFDGKTHEVVARVLSNKSNAQPTPSAGGRSHPAIGRKNKLPWE